jgi:hypothetical protein
MRRLRRCPWMPLLPWQTRIATDFLGAATAFRMRF